MQNNLDIFVSVVSAIILILIATQLCGRLFSYLKQPKVVGEMVAGVLLGPTCLGYFFPAFSGLVFSQSVMPYIFVLSNIGLSVYMFIVALEIDFSMFDKKMVKQSSVLSALIIIVPFALGAGGGVFFFDQLRGSSSSVLAFCIFLGAAMSITAFPMLARILQENNLVKTRLGTLALLSASIQDVISWIFLSFVIAMAKGESSGAGLKTMVGAAIFVGAMIFIVKPLVRRLSDKVKAGKMHIQRYFSFIALLLLICALVTDYIGLYSVFGGFVLGLIVPREHFIIENITSRLKDFTVVLLLPLFFAFSGLNANLLALGQLNYFIPCLIIILLSFVGKHTVTTLVMKSAGFNWRSSSAIGGLMNARGLMELIIANVGLMFGVISNALYSILILVAVLSTLLAMPVYNFSMGKKSLVDPDQKPSEEATPLGITDEAVIEPAGSY